MPSQLHEALIQLFRDCPSMAAELLGRELAVPVPAHTSAQVAESGASDATPTTYRADLVVALRAEERTELAIVIEVQLRVDPRKKRTWPHYLTSVGAELDSKAIVLVVTPDEKVQRWAAEPIEVGLGHNVITPFVLGPAAIPDVEHKTALARPELAVLVAMIAHGLGSAGLDAAELALRASAHLDEDTARRYTNFVLSVLSEADREEMERRMREGENVEIVDYVQQWQDKASAEARAKTRVEVQVEAVLAVLDARGLQPNEALRDRVRQSTDLEQLKSWLIAAAQADRLDDVFDEG